MFKKFKVLKTLLFSSFIFFACKGDNNSPKIVDKNPTNAMRGVWVTNVDSRVLYTKQGILDCVALCKKSGINTIFMVVWNKGYTLYPSAKMKEIFGKEIDPDLAGRDPLKEMIEAAHAQNIKVYAWFEYGFAADYQGVGGHILATKPNWAAKNSVGNTVNKNGFNWMNALDPEVQDFMKSLVLETVKNYDIDGIQGDDRLPALPVEAGYNKSNLDLYLASNNNIKPSGDADSNWMRWRVMLLNNFMKSLYASVKSAKSSVQVSMGPSIYPFSYDQYLQDWPSWVSEGSVDNVCPQIYRYNIDAYKAELAKITNGQVPKSKLGIVAPGVLLKVGTYTPTDDFLRQMINANREAGYNGEVFFFYEGLKLHASYFENEYQ